jgi:hypothetical protein
MGASGAVMALWVATLFSAGAATVYTNEADFVAAINSFPVFLNEFTNFDYLGQLAHPLNACEGDICHSIYTQPPVHLVTFNGAVSTVKSNDEIVVLLTAGNVRAWGGWFFVADTNAAPSSGTVTVTLSDGTAVSSDSLSNATPPFLGFVSTGPVLTNLFVQYSGTNGRPAIAHFYAAIGVASVTTAVTATNTLLISWPAPGTGCVLQSCSDVSGTNWVDVNVIPQQVGGLMQVTVPISGSQRIFRLQKQ